MKLFLALAAGYLVGFIAGQIAADFDLTDTLNATFARS